MKLARKNFFYTAVVTGILTVIVIGYFVFMLPSLYVAYMSDSYYDDIVNQHTTYVKEKSYDHVKVSYPTCMSIDIPMNEDSFVIVGKNFKVTVTPKTPEMKSLLSDMKSYAKESIKIAKKGKKGIDEKQFNKKVEDWKNQITSQVNLTDNTGFDVTSKTNAFQSKMYKDEFGEIHFLSKKTMILVSGVSDGENHYSNYFGITYEKEHLIISYLPAMTPQMTELRPIVLHSLPMLLAVLFLFALVVSYLYSRGIVNPILRLVKHTQRIRSSDKIFDVRLPVEGKDEIAILVQTLNELYEKLEENYKELEQKKEELEQKNKSKEVFLRSSSHQLKTPIAAALLLTEGMINQIGKYKEHEIYLPEVKKQLLSMRKIVEDILALSRCEEQIEMQEIDLEELLKMQLAQYEITLTEAEDTLVFSFEEECILKTDATLFCRILSNLITNAVVHSAKNATITITTKKNCLTIHNTNAHIEENEREMMFEPFVKGSKSSKGHGLGLYIVKYYAQMLSIEVTVENDATGVLTTLTFCDL